MTSKVTALARRTGIEDRGRVSGAGTKRPDPEVPERSQRRTFTAKDKAEILAGYDAAADGEKGLLLRCEGLYSSHIDTAIAANMRIKVKVSETERFVICHNPEGAEHDAHIRAQLVAQLDELIAGSDTLSVGTHGAARADLGQARAGTLPSSHTRRAAAHRQG